VPQDDRQGTCILMGEATPRPRATARVRPYYTTKRARPILAGGLLRVTGGHEELHTSSPLKALSRIDGNRESSSDCVSACSCFNAFVWIGGRRDRLRCAVVRGMREVEI